MGLADHTLALAAPEDAYRFKAVLYDRLTDAGIPVEPRSFLYGRCPVDGSVIVRGEDERLTWISADIQPTVKPRKGRQYDFCLRASPMRQSEHGKIPADDPAQWLADRAEPMGVEFLHVEHRASRTWCSKSNGVGRRGFYIPDVVYLGRLRVVDPVNLSRALAEGIGRHRAFGFGLLQLF